MEASTKDEVRKSIAKARKSKRIIIDGSDVERGDPAQLVLGKEEKPARVHKPLPKKRRYNRSPARMAMDELRKDIGLMNELDQYARACEAKAARERAKAERARVAIKLLEVKGD